MGRDEGELSTPSFADDALNAHTSASSLKENEGYWKKILGTQRGALAWTSLKVLEKAGGSVVRPHLRATQPRWRHQQCPEDQARRQMFGCLQENRPRQPQLKQGLPSHRPHHHHHATQPLERVSRSGLILMTKMRFALLGELIEMSPLLLLQQLWKVTLKFYAQ